MSRRPGYILGDHWLEVAFDRICAGDREEAVLEDYGWVAVERLRLTDAEREAIEEAIKSFDEFAGDRVYATALRGLLSRMRRLS